MGASANPLSPDMPSIETYAILPITLNFKFGKCVILEKFNQVDILFSSKFLVKNTLNKDLKKCKYVHATNNIIERSIVS